jgi:hypothetical protein
MQPSAIFNVPPSFRDAGTWEQGNAGAAYVNVPPQILGNVEGDVRIFNIGDPTGNTTKFISLKFYNLRY